MLHKVVHLRLAVKIYRKILLKQHVALTLEIQTWISFNRCHFSFLSTLIMSGSIQLFQSVQEYYQTLGILPNSQSNRKFSVTFPKLIPIFFLSMSCISSSAFLLFEAKTTSEYGGAFYAFISELCILYIFFVQVWQMPNTLQLVANFEKFIEKSKYHEAYNIQNKFFRFMNNFLVIFL